jgi:predicted transcriptional regulator
LPRSWPVGCWKRTIERRTILLSEVVLPESEPPVSRYDIADHVGIAVETVSRAITELRRQGVIELETPRCLAMKDTQKLVDGVQVGS